MDVIEFRPTPDQYAWTFGGAKYVHKVAPGSILQLWTDDAFSGQLRSTKDKLSALADSTKLNPQTGPFFVEGASPGDTLVVHVAALEPARDWGVSCMTPLFGALTATDRTAMLHEPLPEATWLYQLDRSAKTVLFEAKHSELSIQLPTNLMLGTIGVAPAGGEVRSSLVPDKYGGNMDLPEVTAGATVFLGVNVEGALLSIGDGHYRQGQGESCGSAVEGAMHATLLVELIKGCAPAWPRLETDDSYITVGSSRPLEDAWRISQREMVVWLGELYSLHPLDAYQLLTQISGSSLANVVNLNYTAITKVSKSLLPSTTNPYRGIHQYLVEQCRALSL